MKIQNDEEAKILFEKIRQARKDKNLNVSSSVCVTDEERTAVYMFILELIIQQDFARLYSVVPEHAVDFWFNELDPSGKSQDLEHSSVLEPLLMVIHSGAGDDLGSEILALLMKYNYIKRTKTTYTLDSKGVEFLSQKGWNVQFGQHPGMF